MKKLLVLTLAALTIGAQAQNGIPVPRFDYVGCFSDGGYSNMFALDCKFNVLTRSDIPGMPPAYFGMQAALKVPMQTSALRLQVATAVWGGNVVNQVVQVYDFYANEWATMQSDAIGGLGPWPPRVIEIIIASPLPVYPAPFVDPVTGQVAVRVLWNGRQTNQVLVDYFDLKPFP